MNDFVALIAQYGYFALFIGCLLEGESILLLAGSLIHVQQFSIYYAWPIAVLGGFLGDLLFFLLGRYAGGWILQRFPRLQPTIDKVLHKVVEHDIYIIIAIRFMYGFRIAGPIAIGMSKISIWRFMVFNLLGSILWATLFLSLGYLLGQSIHYLIQPQHIGVYLLCIVITLMAGFLLLSWFRKIRKPK